MSDNTTPQDVPMLNVDGVNFPISSLPEDIKDLISIYQNWEVELKNQRVEVFKLEAAIRGVSTEIQSRVRALAVSKTTEDPDKIS